MTYCYGNIKRVLMSVVLFKTQEIVIEDVNVRGFLDVYVKTDKEVSL